MKSINQNPANSQGIAIIVVVAVMVALIMVTTALMATVTRTTNTARAIFNRDLARLAAQSGQSLAIYSIRNVIQANKMYNAYGYYDSTYTKLSSTDFPVATAPNIDYSTVNSDCTAHGLIPCAKVSIVGRSYVNCPHLAPFDTVETSTANNYLTGSGTITTSTNFSSGAAFDSSSTSSNNPLAFVSIPADNSGSGHTYLYPRYINLVGYDKNFTVTSTHVPSDPLSDTSFYFVRYSYYVQDLGGCLNVYNPSSGNNNYTDSKMVPVLNDLYEQSLSASWDSVNATSSTTFVSDTGSPSQLSLLKGSLMYSSEGITNILGRYDHAFYLPQQCITQFGKVDSSGVPLCVNLYSAPKAVVNTLVKNALVQMNNAVEIYKAKADQSDPAAISFTISSLTSTQKANVVSGIWSVISAKQKSSDSTATDITTIGSDIINHFSSDVSEQRAARLVVLALLGVLSDVSDDSTVGTGDEDALIVPGSAAATQTKVQVPVSTIKGWNLGRFVAAGSATSSATVVMTVNRDTIGPGPYFRVITRGALFNAGKSELVTASNLECIYEYNPSTGRLRQVYHRWFENE